MDIRIDASAAGRLAHAFERAPEIVDRELLAFATEATTLLEREVVENTPRGVGGGGGLAGSIFSEVQPLASGAIGLVATSIAHAVPVELGTRPHRPPIEPLIDWVKQILNVAQEKARGVAFAVANKIARVGTEGRFMFRDTFNQNEQQVLRMMMEAIDRIEAQVGVS